MAASSSSVILSALSRASRRASSHVLGPAALLSSLRLSLIFPALLPSRLAQADHPDQFAAVVFAFGEYQHMEIGADEALRNLA